MREKYQSLALADLKEIAKSRGIKANFRNEKGRYHRCYGSAGRKGRKRTDSRAQSRDKGRDSGKTQDCS